MKRKSYVVKVLTPLHIGAGQGLAHVDLPIVREVHTGFPFVPASGIKGALREQELKKLSSQMGWNKSLDELDKVLAEWKKEETESEKKKIEIDRDIAQGFVNIFGSQNEAGKVIFTDARLLLFPVRTLKGVFMLATCPYVLKRLCEDLGLSKNLSLLEGLEDNTALVVSDKHLVDGKVLLEEFVFEAKKEEALKNFFENMPIEVERIVCVSDTVFSEFVQNYTEVQTHIRINPDTGTVDSGALWTAEYLPAESVFYFSLFFEEDIDLDFPDRLHLGGDITTGKGFVRFMEVVL